MVRRKKLICLPKTQDKRILTNKVFWFLTMTIGLLFCIQSAIDPYGSKIDRPCGVWLPHHMASATTFFGILEKSFTEYWSTDGTPGTHSVGHRVPDSRPTPMFAEAQPILFCRCLPFGFGMGGVVPMQGAIVGAPSAEIVLARCSALCAHRCLLSISLAFRLLVGFSILPAAMSQPS